jgi:hypothetical protein
VSHGVIDLGDLSAGSGARPPAPASRRPPVPYRALLGALALLLAGSLAGAAHRGPPAPPAVVATRLSDTTLVTRERLFVVTPGAGTVAAYALPDGRPLHRTTVPGLGSAFNVVEAGPVLLVSYQADRGRGEEVTAAAETGSGRERWRRPSRLVGLSRADGVVLLRENSAEAGGADWQAVDLDTGAVRWTVREPARGFTTVDRYTGSYPRLLVTATDRGDIEVRDAVTGAVRARTRVPMPVRQPDVALPVWPAGELLLVGEGGGTVGYTLPGLTRVWRSAENLTGRWVEPDCGGVVCALDWPGGVRALDPATGELRWSHDSWNHVREVGGYLLAGNDSGPPADRRLTVVDPRTGRVRGDFGRWQTLGPARPDGTVLGIRTESPGDLVRYAVLDPARMSVRLLGTAQPVSGDCNVTPRALVCRRIDASVGIWRLG